MDGAELFVDEQGIIIIDHGCFRYENASIYIDAYHYIDLLLVEYCSAGVLDEGAALYAIARS